MSFQTQVNVTPAPAMPGDFASGNPRATVLAGPGAIVAGSSGLTVGAFAWLDTTSYSTASNTGTGLPDGFVRNNHSAMITAYLGETSMVIPAGQPVELFSGGDFWAKNGGSATSVPGQKVFAKLADGSVAFAAAGSALTGYIETNWFVRSAVAVGELAKISSHSAA